MKRGHDNPSQLLRPEDAIPKVSFLCQKKEGAVLSLPVPAKMENTVVSADFGRWILKHIDCWIVWAWHLGLGIDRMEDIILVTRTHRLLRSSGTFGSTWAGWLRPCRLARCTRSLRFKYSVRADGLLEYGWYRVARAWEISQAYEVFRGDLYVSHFKTRLIRELRPKA